MIWLDSLYLSIRNDVLSRFQTVLSVKYKLQALLSSFDLWGDVKPWSSFNKNKSTNQCAFLRHSHARSPLVFCFSFSPNMFEMNNFNPRIIKEKNPFWLAGISDDNAIG